VTSTHETPAARPEAPSAPTGRILRWDRLVTGLLLAAAGTGWLLTELGATVPWHLGPAAALVVIGAALVLSLAGGRGRGNLAALGIVIAVVAIGIGIGADRFAGPVGDRTLTPGTAAWPAPTRIAAGTVTVDLTRAPLPTAGRLDVRVGTGRVVVRLPADRAVQVRASIVAGTVTVDGDPVQQGLDIRWTDPAGATAPLVVALDLGAGDVEVSRARS
jgi:Cell wall-active antibiotics response 4TMS YvqF